jgi:hypothetical protein
MCALLAIVVSAGSSDGRTGVAAVMAGPSTESATGPENPQAKLESALAQLAEAFGSGGLPAVAQTARQLAIPLRDDRVRAILEVKAGRVAGAMGAVTSLNGQVEKVHGDLGWESRIKEWMDQPRGPKRNDPAC